MLRQLWTYLVLRFPSKKLSLLLTPLTPQVPDHGLQMLAALLVFYCGSVFIVVFDFTSFPAIASRLQAV